MKTLFVYLVLTICFDSEGLDCQTWVPEKWEATTLAEQNQDMVSCENLAIAHYSEKGMNWNCAESGLPPEQLVSFK